MNLFHPLQKHNEVEKYRVKGFKYRITKARYEKQCDSKVLTEFGGCNTKLLDSISSTKI